MTADPLSDLPPATLVTEEESLARARERFATTPWLGVSVELNATRSYRRRICLLQLNIGGESCVVDPFPFEGKRPDPIAELLGALPEGAPMIVHGGEYALAALERELKVSPPASLVDLQQAAVLLGLPATGLRSLCAALLDVELPPPRSLDWAQRPLALEAVEHALVDVVHLGALYDALIGRIRAADLEDELAIASRPPPARALPPDTPNPRRFRRIAGASMLPPDGLELLGALVQWRDLKAKELDVPPGSLLTNAQLVELAHAPERAHERLASMRFHSRLVHADLEALRRVVALAKPSGPEPRPPPPSQPPRKLRKGPPSPAVRARISRLKNWRREEAEARGVGLQAILPAAALEHLAYFPETPLAEVPALGRRRSERYAEILGTLISSASR